MAEFWLPSMCQRQREAGDDNGDRISDVHPRTGDLARGHVVWTPPADARRRFVLGRYLDWLAAERGHGFAGDHDLPRWSLSGLAGFWARFGPSSTLAPMRRTSACPAWIGCCPSPDALASPASVELFAAYAA